MLTVAVWLSLLMLSVAATLTFRTLIRGPDLPDRVLALDTLYINAVAMIVLVGIDLHDTVYFEAALLIATLITL